MITPHALARYRERFDSSATAAQVAALLFNAEPAEDWVCEAFADLPSATDDAEYLVQDDVVFVVVSQSCMTFGRRRTAPELVLVTVLCLEWAEKKFGRRYQ